MNNYFQQLKRRRLSQEPPTHKKPNIYIHNSYERRQQFLNHITKPLLQSLQQGTKIITKEQTQPFHLHLYKNNLERIKAATQDYQSAHLPPEPFTEAPALKLRARQKDLEGPEWSQLQHPKLRKDQANYAESLNKNILDTEAKDMSMVYFPQWKHERKTLWVAEKPFNSTILPKQQSVSFSEDVYIEGYEILGDLSRRFKPICRKKEFTSTIRSRADTSSLSLRQGNMESVLKSYNNSECSTTIPKIYCKSIRQELEQMSRLQKV